GFASLPRKAWRGTGRRLLQLLHLDLPKAHHGARVVTLQREVALGEVVVWVSPVNGDLPVDLDGDVAPLHGHFLREPLIRPVWGLVHYRDFVLVILQLRAAVRVETSGADRVAMRGVDLRLVAGREAAFEPRAEVLPAVAMVVDLGLDAVFEVHVIVALTEQVARRPAADEDSVL